MISEVPPILPLALSAFLASAAGCTGLTTQILPGRLKDVPYPLVEDPIQEGRKATVGHHPTISQVNRRKPGMPRVLQDSCHVRLSKAANHKE